MAHHRDERNCLFTTWRAWPQTFSQREPVSLHGEPVSLAGPVSVHPPRVARAADKSDDEQAGYQANVNQARQEPVPASHGEQRRQEAVVRNEDYAHGHPARPAEPGEAVGHLMGGPASQSGDGNAHATQVAAIEPTEDGRPPQVTRASKAVPGKPDGEVGP